MSKSQKSISRSSSRNSKRLTALKPWIENPKTDSAIYTDVEIDLVESGSKATLSVSTNRLEAIIPFKMASAKLPYKNDQTIQKAYLRQSTPKILPVIPKPKHKPKLFEQQRTIDAVTDEQYIEQLEDP